MLVGGRVLVEMKVTCSNAPVSPPPVVSHRVFEQLLV